MIGLFPAAGRATRLALAENQSKEVLEISPGRRAGDCLLRAYAAAEIEKALIIHRAAKDDIKKHYQSHPIDGLPMQYLVVDSTASTVHTLQFALQKYPHKPMALGFPDIQFNVPLAFVKLRQLLESNSADIVLGLFKTDRPDKVDMVDCDQTGTVREIIIKPAVTDLQYSWVLAAWRPRFNEWLGRNLKLLESQQNGELYVGHAIQAVMAEGWDVRGLFFQESKILDIGTRDDLARAKDFYD